MSGTIGFKGSGGGAETVEDADGKRLPVKAVLTGGGTGATDLGKAEDAAHASGDVGVMLLAVRQDSPTALAANGDYIPLIVGADGSLHVKAVAAESHIGAVGGHSEQVAPDALAVSTSPAYSVGDIIGGKLVFTNAMRVSGGGGVLQSLFMQDLRNQKPALELLLFNADPSQGTYTDNAACPSFLTNSADAAKQIRRISIAASDWVTVGSVATVDLSPGGRLLKSAATRNLWGLLVIAGSSTPTYGATTDLSLRLGILND